MGVVAGLSLSAAFCFGFGLVLSNLGLRGMSPLKGAAVGIPVAAAGFLAPWLAGAAMALSSVSVTLNALRLQRVKLN